MSVDQDLVDNIRDAIVSLDAPIITVEDVSIIIGVSESRVEAGLEYLENHEQELASRNIDGTRVWWKRTLVEEPRAVIDEG